MVISLTMHIKLSAGKRKKKVETQVGWHCGQRTIGQGSRALTHTDSPLGGQAADGAENPSWQQSCISTFFFFCQHSCVCSGFRFQQPHIWELHARTVNHLVYWPWDPTLSLLEVGLAAKTKKRGFLPRGPPTQGRYTARHPTFPRPQTVQLIRVCLSVLENVHEGL